MCEEVGPLTLCVSPNRRRGCGYASPETRLNASCVFASTGVDPNRFPNVDEERHLHDEARLDRCGLAATRGRVALKLGQCRTILRSTLRGISILIGSSWKRTRSTVVCSIKYGKASVIWSPFKGNCSKVSLSMK